MAPIDLAALNGMTQADFVEALVGVFENAPWVAEAAAGARPFASLSAMFAAFGDAVRKAEPERILGLIRNHPDLAGKAARAGALSPESTAEQAGAGLDRLSEAEYATFHRLNDAYRAKFGIPFIICVRRHTKDSILRQFERRLKNDMAAELETAVVEIMRIAALRLDQQVAGPGRLKVHGRLSTHVLDTHLGRPAEGVEVELVELAAAGAPRRIACVTTNADGRTDRPLIDGRPVPIGHYELRFDVGGYFARRAVPMPDPPFLDIVPVRFGVAEPEASYHVPLLVTPWSFASYRGS
ncbi:MAG TPA: 2-oxo-4-hydroxy-4-carboxy-5-ureidoimidazoline decarboxylase [Alphaproteobacteria bacterium]